MNRTIDYSALTAPVTREEVTAFRTESKRTGQFGTSNTAAQIVVGVFAAVAIGFVSISLFAAIGFGITTLASGDTADGVGLLFPALILIGLLVLGTVVLARVLSKSTWERLLRLSRFGTANGLVFAAKSPNPSYPGAIFNRGDSRASLNHFRSAPSDRFFDFGTYTFSTGSGKSRATHKWGFLALNLDRALPHMVLDSRANNSWLGSNLPATFSKDQILRLEGDFNEHFTLYSPKEYERDALYVFTPDLMALLIDNAAPFDVEIVDQWMFVYSRRAFEPLDPATYHRLFGIIDTVGAKTLTQTDRYVDDRVGTFAANVVAPPGKRLKRSAGAVAIIIFIAVGAMWAATFVGDLVNLFK